MESKNKSLFEYFKEYRITELQDLIYSSEDREEKIFYNRVLNFKLGVEQEKAIGKKLL